MLATYNEMLGLTGVKAAYPNCLLINNCAVYQGCVDAAWLYSVLPECGEKAAEMEAYASRLCEGIETYFWDETSGRYRTAVSQDGEPVDADESTEAFAQLYPLLCGLPEADGARGQALYAAFRDEAMSGWLAQTTGAEIRAVLGQGRPEGRGRGECTGFPCLAAQPIRGNRLFISLFFVRCRLYPVDG